jgi:hypothetical protein
MRPTPATQPGSGRRAALALVGALMVLLALRSYWRSPDDAPLASEREATTAGEAAGAAPAGDAPAAGGGGDQGGAASEGRGAPGKDGGYEVRGRAALLPLLDGQTAPGHGCIAARAPCRCGPPRRR